MIYLYERHRYYSVYHICVKYTYVSPALRDLHWLPIKQRIEFKLCLLVHWSFTSIHK